jgi:hypothetical protein
MRRLLFRSLIFVLAIALMGVWGYWVWINFPWILYFISNHKMTPRVEVLPVNIVEKVKDLGYKTNGQFVVGDVSGRSLIYWDRKGSEDLIYQFVFDHWETTGEGNDRYMINQLVTKSGGNPRYEKSRVVFNKNDDLTQTELRLDNLTTKERSVEVLGNVGDLPDDLIKSGDVLSYSFKVNSQGNVVVDSNRIPILEWIEIRRFK